MSARIADILKSGKREHELEPPASDAEIKGLVDNTKFDLPAEYIEFLKTHNGGNGDLPVQPCWYELWPASEVVENNENYEVVKCLPEFLALGSNQGGELLYIDYRKSTLGNIVSIPLIPSDADYAMLVATSFNEFIQLLGKECECE